MWGQAKPHTDLVSFDEPVTSIQSYADRINSIIAEKQRLHAERRKRRNDQQRAYLNKNRQDQDFCLHQLVYLKEHAIAKGDTGSVLLMPKIGPFSIEHIGDNNHTALLKHLTTGELRLANFQHLTPYTADNPINPVPTLSHATTLLRNANRKRFSGAQNPAIPEDLHIVTTDQPQDLSADTATSDNDTADEDTPALRRSPRLRRPTPPTP